MKYLALPAFNNLKNLKRFSGVYQLLSCGHVDLADTFQYEFDLTDGANILTVFSAKNTSECHDFASGAFVHVELVRDHNNVWKTLNMKVVSSRLALHSVGIKMDVKKLQTLQDMTFDELLNEVQSPVFQQIISLANEEYKDKFQVAFKDEHWISISAWRYLCNILAVEFESEDERNSAVIVGLFYAVFIDYIGPHRRVDLLSSKDTLYQSYVEQVFSFLKKYLPKLVGDFETLVIKTSPLVKAPGLLLNDKHLAAIQIVCAQSVQALGHDHYDDLMHAA